MKKALLLFVLLSPCAMAQITGTQSTVSYTCAGSTGPYSFTFPAVDAGALQVIEIAAGALPGVMTILPSTSWTATPVNNSYANGGSVTLTTACASGYTLTIARVTEQTQLTQYTEYMPAMYANIQGNVDQLTANTQDLLRQSTVYPGVMTGGGSATLTYTPLGQYLNLTFPASGGTITAVNAGSGMTGGGTSGGVTVACLTAAVGTLGCSSPDGTTITVSGGVLTSIGSMASLPKAPASPSYPIITTAGSTIPITVGAGAGNTPLLAQGSGTNPFNELYGQISNANIYTSGMDVDGDSIACCTLDIPVNGTSSGFSYQAHMYQLASYAGITGYSLSATQATLTGAAISGTTLTFASNTGTVAAGQVLYDTTGNVAAGTTILSGSGLSWTVNITQTVTSETMTTKGQITSGYPLNNTAIAASICPDAATRIFNYWSPAGGATFSASISGTTLTLTSNVTSGTIAAGQYLFGAGNNITAGIYIVSGSGQTNGSTWTISASNPVSSETMNSFGDNFLRVAQVGMNDANHFGLGYYEQIYTGCVGAMAAFNAMVPVYTGASFGSLPTNWTSDTTYASMTGLQSNTNAATSTWNYTTTYLGETVGLLYWIQDNNYGMAQITDSGGAPASAIGLPGPNLGANISISSNSFSTYSTPQVLMLPNPQRGAGSYTVTAKVLSTGASAGGSGYTANPTVGFGQGGEVSAPTGCVAAQTAGVVTGVTCSTYGSFQAAPLIYFTGTGATFLGTISTTTLTVTSVTSGTIAIGQILSGNGVAPNTVITAGSGLSWTVSVSQTVTGANPITSSPIQAQAVATLVGSALSYSVSFGGYYASSTPPTITVSGGCGGSGAAPTATMAALPQGGYTIASVSGSGGSGYACYAQLTAGTGGAKIIASNAASAISAITLVPSNMVHILGVVMAPPANATANTNSFFFMPVYRQGGDVGSLATYQYWTDGMFTCNSLRNLNVGIYCPNTRNGLQGTLQEMGQLGGLHPTVFGATQLAAYEEQPIPVYVPKTTNTIDPSQTPGYLGPSFPISSVGNSGLIPCNFSHVVVTGAANMNVYLPPATCMPRPGTQFASGVAEDRRIGIYNAMSGNQVNVSTLYGGVAIAYGNANNTIIAAGASQEYCLTTVSSNPYWNLCETPSLPANSTIVTPTITTPSFTGTPTFSASNLAKVLSGNNNEWDFLCQPGSSADQACYFEYLGYTGTVYWKLGWASNHGFNLIDQVNGVTRISMTPAGQTVLTSGGTQNVCINCSAVAGTGTGGTGFGSGASATPTATVSAAGAFAMISDQGNATATFAFGAGAGTTPGTPVCATSHVCDSMGGTVAMTTGTTPPTTGIALTVTTGITRTNQPTCKIEIRLAASPYTLVDSAPTYTTTTVVFNLTGTALTAGTAYNFTYSGCDGN